MKAKHLTAYLNSAKEFAKCSTAVKLKVGAIVAKDGQILSVGYNGTPPGWNNTCESTVIIDGISQLKTLPEVIHAERNALDKLAKSTESSEGAVMFITHSPCLECAKSIFNVGIKEVYYETDYRSDEGIFFLQKAGVLVKKITT